MNESDWIAAAVKAKDGADKNLKRFAECCANVSGRRTAELAGSCECSVATVEAYRNAYKLYYVMSVNLESEHVQKLWESATIELWKAASRLQVRYDLSYQDVFEYLKTGKENGMSRESFSAHIDEKENSIPKWLRVIKDIAKKLRRDDWKTEIPAELRDEYDEKKSALAEVLERIAESVTE